MIKNILEVDNLTKSFGNVSAVKGISFSIKEGEILGLLGPNGPLGAGGAFSADGPFANNVDGITLIEEDYYSDNYCYFSDTGDFSGDSLEFLRDFAEEDLDAYLEDNNGDIENFGKMFCYPDAMEDIELMYFS
mgnify:CR=1 FL=1